MTNCHRRRVLLDLVSGLYSAEIQRTLEFEALHPSNFPLSECAFENLLDALILLAEISEEFEFIDEVAGLNFACLHFLVEGFKIGRKDANQHSDMFAILSVSLGKFGEIVALGLKEIKWIQDGDLIHNLDSFECSSQLMHGNAIDAGHQIHGQGIFAWQGVDRNLSVRRRPGFSELSWFSFEVFEGIVVDPDVAVLGREWIEWIQAKRIFVDCAKIPSPQIHRLAALEEISASARMEGLQKIKKDFRADHVALHRPTVSARLEILAPLKKSSGKMEFSHPITSGSSPASIRA